MIKNEGLVRDALRGEMAHWHCKFINFWKLLLDTTVYI
jgi:hypothetical protein